MLYKIKGFLFFFCLFVTISFAQSDTLSKASLGSKFKIEGRVSIGSTIAFLSHETFSYKRLMPRYTLGLHFRPEWRQPLLLTIYPTTGVIYSRWVSSNYKISGEYIYEERFIISHFRVYGGLEFKIHDVSFLTGMYFFLFNKKFNQTLVYEDNHIIYNQIHLLKYSWIFRDKWVIFGEIKYVFNPRWSMGIWMAIPTSQISFKALEMSVYYKIF